MIFLRGNFTHRLAVMSALTLIAGWGCGSGHSVRDQSEVSGKVTLNGAPLTSGSVSVYSEKTGSGGICPLDGAGHYRIKNLIAPEVYAVTIIGPEQVPDAPPPPPSEIPQKYQSSSTSGLSVQITSGKNTFDISLEK